MPGATFDDVVRIELRDIHAALHMEQIRAFLPLSRWWLEHSLGISEPKEPMLLQADQGLPPEIRKMDLFLVVSAANKLPRGEGPYVFSVPTGFFVKRVEVGLTRGIAVNGPGISEDLGPMEIDRLLVGRVIFRAERMYRNLSLEASNTVNALSSGGQVGPSEHLRPRRNTPTRGPKDANPTVDQNSGLS